MRAILSVTRDACGTSARIRLNFRETFVTSDPRGEHRMWLVIVSEFSYSIPLHRHTLIAATIAFGGIHSRVIFLR